MNNLERERRNLLKSMIGDLQRKMLSEINEGVIPEKVKSAKLIVDRWDIASYAKKDKARKAVYATIEKLRADTLFGDVFEAKKRIEKMLAK